MAVEQGLVTETQEDGWAQVMVQREPGCPYCGAALSCGAFDGGNRKPVRALNKAGAQAGDAVSIVHGTGSLKSAAVTYLIPTAGLILGAVAGSQYSGRLGWDENVAAMVLALCGVAVGFGVSIFLGRRMARNEEMIPVITRILDHKPGPSCPMSGQGKPVHS